MAENPITVSLPADLPTNWVYGQTVAPEGSDVGLSQQHGYNYLMQQVNAAQQAAEDLGEAFPGLASLDSNGKVPEEQLPEMDYDPAGSAAAVQQELTAHTGDKNNPHGVTAVQVGADPAGSAAAVQQALNAHTGDKNNPHGITAQQIGALSALGGIVNGPIILSEDPTQAMQAATKQYVDSHAIKIAVGNYKGTGVAGSSNPNTIVFPQGLLIMCAIYRMPGVTPGKGSQGYWKESLLAFINQQNSYVSLISPAVEGNLNITISSNILSFYTDDTTNNASKIQLNDKGQTYYYVGLLI